MATQSATAHTTSGAAAAAIRDRLNAELRVHVDAVSSLHQTRDELDPAVYAHGLSAAERRVAEIQAAVERLIAGRYGQCERCAQMVPSARLDYLPHARYCITCQSSVDASR
ncbi:MAG: TraR/DksA C4-type zinc finger protein [Candidatus Nanopelagicales bacterium]